MTPSEEEFAAWRDDPVTKWVLMACRQAASDCRRHWEETSWANGQADQGLLTEQRVRADAYLALAETDYTGWLATHEGAQ